MGRVVGSLAVACFALLVSSCSGGDAPQVAPECTATQPCPDGWLCHTNNRCYQVSTGNPDASIDASGGSSGTGGDGGSAGASGAGGVGGDAGGGGDSGTGGVGGTGGDGGDAGVGGAGGDAGAGGVGGTAGVGGAGGDAGVGGAGGAGGAAGDAGIGGVGGAAGAGGDGADAAVDAGTDADIADGGHDAGGAGATDDAGDTGGTGGAGGTGGTGGTNASHCLQGAGGDYTTMGPYAVTQSDVTVGNLGTYTIFRPTNLDTTCWHPMIAWGNGTGVTGSNIYAFYQTHAASWGMVVIASHSDQAASMDYLAGGLSYLLDQNQSSASPLFGKLSDKAGTAGHSQGGFAATTATSHPNVVAEVCVQGGGSPPAKVAFMCLTGTEDFVRTQCTAAYTAAAGPAFLGNYQGADHNTTPTLGGWFQGQAGTRQYQRLYTAWFRCHLAGDETACAMFRGGATCGICNEPNWAEIRGKNF